MTDQRVGGDNSTRHRVGGRLARSHADPAVVGTRIDPGHEIVASSEGSSRRSQGACIHLGMPKAASTSFQGNLFLGHSGINYLGLIFPGRALGSTLTESSKALVRLLRQSPHDEPTEEQLRHCRAGMTEHLETTENGRRIPVWSNELLCTTKAPQQRHARIFREVLGPCNVLLVVRHPVKFAESLYHTHCTAVNRHPPRRYRDFPPESREQVRRYRRWLDENFGKAPLLPDIGMWFERMWSDPESPQTDLACLQYADTARNYADVFGHDNVRIVLFEQMVAEIPKVIGDVCDFMGIDREEGIEQMQREPCNLRWTSEQVERIREIQQSTWKKLLFRWASPERRQKMMHWGAFATQANAPKASVEIPGKWQERLADYTRDQNRRLKEEWGLPVELYDYPL